MPNKFNKYYRVEKFICPECRGDKTVMVFNEEAKEREEQLCSFCEGEGIVFKCEEFLSLNDANKARK